MMTTVGDLLPRGERMEQAVSEREHQAFVTLRVEGMSKTVKTKDGRYLHLGISPSGRLYGFYAEPLAKGTFTDACGALGSLKKTKDGAPIVYLKHTKVWPRPDILNDCASVPPDGMNLFSDLPDEHPWQP
jgi:hypothetical protein